ncbi:MULTISPECIES: hypothetical protein [Oceanobacillus]|uniref:hypothetical protein n=1 Tax=Oceanobacillus TaxID=182709 RepID=UPI0030DDCB96
MNYSVFGGGRSELAIFIYRFDIISFVFVLIGCQPKKEMLMIETYDINAISISESTSFGKFNNDFFTTEETTQELREALNL